MKVYMVQGVTGEHDSLRRWTAAAFLDRDLAEERACALNRWCRDRDVHRDATRDTGWRVTTNWAVAFSEWLEDLPRECPLDPNFRAPDLPGTEYKVEELEVEE